MKTKIFIFMILVIAISSCTKDANNTETNLNGNYIGTFERNGNTSNVELTFSSSEFNGQSEIEKFPALCKGSYSISGNTIAFKNACAWTAEFDWSLILDGNWTFDLVNNKLIMNNANGDKYVLKQQ